MASSTADVLARLSFLVGSFSGSERMSATQWAPAGTAQTRTSGRFALQGRLLVQQQIQRRDGEVSFEACNVFMTDTDSGAVMLYGFDTAGFAPDPPARGRWHEDTLRLERVTARGSSLITFTPTDGGYQWSKCFRAPGAAEFRPTITGTLRRDA